MPNRSGKSFSKDNPFGIRRSNRLGQPLPPKSLRRKNSLLIDCPDEALIKAGVQAAPKDE